MYKRVIYKYHSLERIETDKNSVISAFLDNLQYNAPKNVTRYKTRTTLAFSDGKYSELYTLPVKYEKYIDTWAEIRKARQYIADSYHCSGTWGQKVTAEDMKTNLEQWQLETDPEEYCPPIELYIICASYWNELCDMYPN